MLITIGLKWKTILIIKHVLYLPTFIFITVAIAICKLLHFSVQYIFTYMYFFLNGMHVW